MEFNATFLISAISFIVFVLIMNAIFYQPILKIMAERKALIEKNAKDALEAYNNSKEIFCKKEQELAEARAKAKTTVTEGSEKFKNENKAIIDEFSQFQKDKAEAEKAKLKAESEVSKSELRHGVDDISRIISEKILGAENA